MSDLKRYRDESRKHWGTSDEKLTIDQINCGAILRIADSCELMAKEKLDLEKSVEYWKGRANGAELELTTAINRIRGLKSFITRLKSKKFTVCGPTAKDIRTGAKL